MTASSSPEECLRFDCNRFDGSSLKRAPPFAVAPHTPLACSSAVERGRARPLQLVINGVAAAQKRLENRFDESHERLQEQLERLTALVEASKRA